MDENSTVFTRDYLTDLAAAYRGTATDDADDTTAHRLRSRLAELHREKKAITRKLAATGDLDYLEEVVADIEVEEVVLQAQLNDIERPGIPTARGRHHRAPDRGTRR